MWDYSAARIPTALPTCERRRVLRVHPGHIDTLVAVKLGNHPKIAPVVPGDVDCPQGVYCPDNPECSGRHGGGIKVHLKEADTGPPPRR